MYPPLFEHTQELDNSIADIFQADKDLVNYFEIINRTTFRTSIWTYLQKIIFENFISSTASSSLKIAIGTELILKSVYLKDDILDNTKLRNKLNTLAKEIGIGKTILLSDILASKGLRLIQDEVEKLSGTKTANKIISNIILGIENSARGQVLGCIESVMDCTVKGTLKIIELKTCSLIVPLLSIPSYIYGEKNVENVKLFLEKIGMALQIHNDIADYIGGDTLTRTPLLEDLNNKQANIVTSFYLELVDYDKENIIVRRWEENKVTFSQKEKKELFSTTMYERALINSYNLYIDYCDKATKYIITVFNENKQTEVAKLLKYFLEKHG